MRILHITPAYYPATYWGGPIFSVYHMNNALAGLSGIELKVLTTDAAGPKVSNRLSREEKRESFAYEVIFARRIAGYCVSPELLKQLPKWIRWADVVHLTALYSFPTIPVLNQCRMYRRPLVWSLRGALLDDQNCHLYAPPSLLKRSLKMAWNRVCRWSVSPERTVLHVTTEQEREASEKMYPGARFAVVPNGVWIPRALPKGREWMPNGQVRLMFLGRLAPKKGIENLLHAMAKLGPEVHLKLYGTGNKDYERKLKALGQELRLGDRAVFKGHVDGEAKTQAFSQADVCVVPSYSENFCIVVAEALAHGVPVIVSDRLAWEKVAEIGCGLVVPNDPDSLADAVRYLGKMDLIEMGRQGRAWMLRAFDWVVIAERMAKTYQGIVEADYES